MEKLQRRTFVRACLGLILPLGASCDQRNGVAVGRPSQLKIAALFDSRRDPFRNSQAQLLERLAQRRSGTEVVMLDADGDARVQSSQLAAALAAKPDFLIIFPLDPANLAPALVAAGESIPRTFVFAEFPPINSRTSVIVCPEIEVGRVAGEFVAHSLRLKAAEEGRTETSGRVVELFVPHDGRAASGYSAGFLKAILAQPGITLVHQAPCGILGNDTADRIKEVVRIQKEFDVIFAHNDLIANAAVKAIAVAKPDLVGRILVMGVDGSLGKGGGAQLVIKGDIDATVYRPPLVDLAWALVEKCFADPQFTLKARYEIKPVALNLETALKAARTGFPVPPVE